MKKINFKQVGEATEFLFDYRKQKFCLKKKNAGVYGGGAVINLSLVNEFDTVFLTTIGWIAKDYGYDTYKKGSSYAGPKIITIEDSKELALKYIDDYIN